MTATIRRPGPEVIVSSPEDTRRAVHSALARVGVSYDELQRQASTGQFVSVAARMAWIAVRDLREFAD